MYCLAHSSKVGALGLISICRLASTSRLLAIGSPPRLTRTYGPANAQTSVDPCLPRASGTFAAAGSRGSRSSPPTGPSS